MGYMTITMIALTAIAIVFGMLYGLRRGRNRSILRLILILGCVAGAIYLREPVIEFLMESEMAQDLINSLAKELPEGMQSVMMLIIGIVLNLVVYFLLFFVLRIVSWLIIFPIFKIFVKQEIDKKRLAGMFVGLIQGAVIAFAVLVPLNGLATQIDKVSQIKMEMPAQGQGGSGGEEQTGTEKPKDFSLELPEEVGLKEYIKSPLFLTYDKIGGWYFDMLTTVKTSSGELTFDDVSDMAIGVSNFMTLSTEIQQGFDSMKGTSLPAEKALNLKDLGENITEIGNNIDQMSDQAKGLLDSVISSMLGGESDISIDDLKLDSLGTAFTSLANYYDIGTVSQEDATAIVNGVVDNWALIDMFFESGTLIDMNGQDETLIKSALDELNLSDDNQIKSIKDMFGISA